MAQTKKRCINLDWLEVYCLESNSKYPHDAEFFRREGWSVQEREYGTPVYHEMFTLYCSDGLPLIEIRRNPKSAAGRQINGVLEHNSCHIRLCNRTCYMEDAAGIMQSFLQKYDFYISRISRLDICLDFEKFDMGDDPQKFMQRYIAGKYSKINQSKIHAHGLDQWDGRYWNSISWGAAKSMVSTKFYDKTLELKEKSDKPYIRNAWYEANLVDDWHTLEKVAPDGTRYQPKIWRVEFSIKSGKKNWFEMENQLGGKNKYVSIRHNLDQYHTRAQMCDVFFSLAAHYFHFKHLEYIINPANPSEKTLQRKDRCSDKVLFNPELISTFYKVRHTTTSEHLPKAEDRLLKYLYQYQERCYRNDLHNACAVLITELERYTHRREFVTELNDDEIEILRRLISIRMKFRGASLTEDIQRAKAEMQIYNDLFAILKDDSNEK